MRQLLALIPALALAAIIFLAIHASAATITADNAEQLQYLIMHANTTYAINASDGKILIKNTDNHTLLLVFNPAFGIVLKGINGAKVAIVNVTDYSVVKAFDADEAGYAGSHEAPGTALALILPANAAATIAQVYYEAVKPAGGSAEQLKAPAVPEGYTYGGSRDGSGDYKFEWTAQKEFDSAWIALYDSDGDIYAWVAVWGKGQYSDTYVTGKYIWGKKGAWDSITLSGRGYKLKFEIGDSDDSTKSEWSVIWAVKYAGGDEPQPQPEPQPKLDPTTTPSKPAGRLPGSDKTVLYAVAGAAGLALLLAVMSMTGRRR